MKELQSDWGASYQKNTEIARQAARQFGLGKEQLVRMETALGSKALMQFMFKIGSGLVDPDLKGAGNNGNPSGGKGYTREEAIQKMEELKKDKAFGQKFINKDPEALRLFNELNHVIAGGN